MLSGDLGAWERTLAAHTSKLANKRQPQTVTLIEIVDAVELWSDPLTDLAPALAGLEFRALMEQFPMLGCAAASEIGFRFEGVGTVFWAKFEDLLGGPIMPGERALVSRAFAQLADRFALQRPSQSAFSEQFSIIAWPIANALMPYELAGAVGRLLARAPASAVAAAINGRTADLTRLRAWAQTWEGARLTDWLHAAGPAPRVITALLSDNAKNVLKPATFHRLLEAFRHHAEARFALREARRRKPPPSPVVSEAGDLGRLSLRRHGQDLVLSVTWTDLGVALADQGRREAMARGWRPKLWGQSRTAADNVFGPLPIALRLASLPAGSDAAFPDATDRFGADSLVGQTLAGRRVDWGGPLVFLADGESAEQADLPLPARTREIWVIDREGDLAGRADLGRIADTPVRRLDLSQANDRAVAETKGWLPIGAKPDDARPTVARAPQDALSLPRRFVSAQAVYCLQDGETLTVERLRRRDTEAHGLTVGNGREEPPAAPGVFLFERDTAFEAIVGQRLAARLQSVIPGARWPVEVMVCLDETILAYATEALADDGQALGPDSRIVQALQSDAVRQALLRAGRGQLRVRVGRHPWEIVLLQRQDGDVDWAQDDPAAGLARPAIAVAAEARLPFRFAPAGPGPGARLRAFRFEDGRLAQPARLEAPNQFDLGALSGDFGAAQGVRRMRAADGVLDLARARRGWASARAETLAGVMARARVVDQFEAPLVEALCGPIWRELETAAPHAASPGQALFEAIRPHAVGDQANALAPDDLASFAAAFAQAIDQACPDWADDGALDDAGADQALINAFEITIRAAQAEDRLMDLDPDDADFGASGDQWREAAAAALAALDRSPLVELIAPTGGARVLARQRFAAADLAEASAFLVDWTAQWCLPRGQVDLDQACAALQFWLAPYAADPEAEALVAMSRDIFLARAVRFVARRLGGAP